MPANATNFTNVGSYLDFNMTISGTEAVANCSLYIDGILNQSNASTLNNTLTNFVVTGLSWTNHTYYFSCTNSTNSITNSTNPFIFWDSGIAYYIQSQGTNNQPYNETAFLSVPDVTFLPNNNIPITMHAYPYVL